MSFTDKKREEIKMYLLRKIFQDDVDFIEKAMDSFGISITTVKRYLQEETDSQHICADANKGCGYSLVGKQKKIEYELLQDKVEEDKIYAREIAPFLNLDNEKAKRIWYYACAEMLNNVIEHAKGQKLTVLIERNYLFSKVIIVDDGIGIFQNLVHTLAARGWYKPDLEDAIVELYKGKLTSSPDSHSGEGIFFTSKMLDQFFVWSDALIMKCRSIEPTELVQSHLLAYASRFNHVGTLVMMQLENTTDRDLSGVFSLYANMEEGFYKTYIPVKEACITGEPVARSQARRICHRLEEFQEVVFDFSNVEFMGQGFADEVFRVFADAHPDMKLMPENMNADVEMMLRHVINNKKNSNSKTSS